MDLGISGRTAIVCASSKGLGRACAIALADEGCRVIVNGRDAHSLERTAADIRGRSRAEVIAVVGDVSTPEGQAALLAAAPEADILINNNAGPPRRSFRELDRDAMLNGVIANMVTPIELIQQVIDGMAERGFGRIVNITSGSVKAPIAGLDLSSGARAGLTAFMAGVAREVAHRNVTINAILPGMFDTDRLRGAFPADAKRRGVSEDEVADARRATVPARRFGDPDEFGRLCAFLCSQHAGYVTGQNVLIDGGLFPGAF
ncbi:SDR family oxidoreductase [Hansschlegelia quercus]|uniref:SDR family oxidoreductase n=1 Tax=Hansschlegelia quercus TaxID=2528245 RepID=A0A4Q9GCU8_9HYPH|nr:SDR family oxidoreductase [Hansschlegelia quercus]TBN47927.1 SDR family oxidoreductase [Hansschlegelia quercus]